MTSATNTEPTLANVVSQLEKLSNDVEKLSNDVEKLSNDVAKFNDRFSNYQQATQWVVQLAFTLIASATLTIIITAVLRR